MKKSRQHCCLVRPGGLDASQAALVVAVHYAALRLVKHRLFRTDVNDSWVVLEESRLLTWQMRIARLGKPARQRRSHSLPRNDPVVAVWTRVQFRPNYRRHNRFRPFTP